MGYALCGNPNTKEWNVEVQKERYYDYVWIKKNFFVKENVSMFAISLSQILIKFSWVLFVSSLHFCRPTDTKIMKSFY